MNIVKVWGLPQMTAGELAELDSRLVGAAAGVKAFSGMKDSIICIFPASVVYYGGNRILVDASFHRLAHHCSADTVDLAKTLGLAVISMLNLPATCSVSLTDFSDAIWWSPK